MLPSGQEVIRSVIFTAKQWHVYLSKRKLVPNRLSFMRPFGILWLISIIILVYSGSPKNLKQAPYVYVIKVCYPLLPSQYRCYYGFFFMTVCVLCFVFYAVKHEFGRTVFFYDNTYRFKKINSAISVLTTCDCVGL